MITHNRSFLTIQALFCLVHSDIDQIFVAFATSFVDLLRCADEEWDLLVTCIYDGIIPDLEGIGRLRTHLQVSSGPRPRITPFLMLYRQRSVQTQIEQTSFVRLAHLHLERVGRPWCGHNSGGSRAFAVARLGRVFHKYVNFPLPYTHICTLHPPIS